MIAIHPTGGRFVVKPTPRAPFAADPLTGGGVILAERPTEGLRQDDLLFTIDRLSRLAAPPTLVRRSLGRPSEQ